VTERDRPGAALEIVDAQIHSWEAKPSYPWNPGHRAGEEAVPYEAVLAAMNAVGVDAAILHTPEDYHEVLPSGIIKYYDNYAWEAIAKHPDRFAAVGHVDRRAPDVIDQVAAIRAHPGMLAIRIVIRERDLPELRGGGYDNLFKAAARHALPMFMYISGYLPDAVPVLANNPDLRLIIDHFGIQQPPLRKADVPPWRRLPELLALAKFPNVAVKFSGAPTLSLGGYPFTDLWPHLRAVIDAFGAGRLMWGSDFTRVAPVHCYADAVYYIRYASELSDSERREIMGGTARQLLRWPATGAKVPAVGP
jgi:L-fuconolactonase